jgi:hypothetical protein
MWHYLLYFLIGGTVVTVVAYIGGRGNGILAAFVASLPMLFLLNVLLMYRNGGLAAGITYTKVSLLFLPAFACYAALTIWLLPHLSMPKALVLGLPIYAVPIIVTKKIRTKMLKAKAIPNRPPEPQ